MGIVVPFPARAQRADADAVEQAVMQAMGADRAALVTAAGPLLARCRDRYGFVVLRDGLPTDDVALAASILTLAQALKRLDPIIGRRMPTWVFGIRFGGADLACASEDGSTLFDVPVGIAPEALARFLGERVSAAVA